MLNHSGILEYSRGYATALVLELYADRTAHEFLVRILRDGQPLKLGLCDDKASCGTVGYSLLVVGVLTGRAMQVKRQSAGSTIG